MTLQSAGCTALLNKAIHLLATELTGGTVLEFTHISGYHGNSSFLGSRHAENFNGNRSHSNYFKNCVYSGNLGELCVTRGGYEDGSEEVRQPGGRRPEDN